MNPSLFRAPNGPKAAPTWRSKMPNMLDPILPMPSVLGYRAMFWGSLEFPESYIPRGFKSSNKECLAETIC